MCKIKQLNNGEIEKTGPCHYVEHRNSGCTLHDWHFIQNLQLNGMITYEKGHHDI